MTEDSWQKTHLKVMAVRPPWSPTDEDVGFVREMAEPVLRASADPAVLVLGVTSRIVQLDWPAGTTITAVDSSPGMIESSWRPHPHLPSRAECASWQNLPFDDGSFDVVAGDGSLNSVPSLTDYGKIFGEVARVLRPGGVIILRCFIRPEQMETPDQVVTAAKGGAFPTTAAFRFRFAMALTEADGSVGLAQLWERFNALVPDRDEMADATGWPRADIDRVDVDRDSKVRFTFPTESRLRELCRPQFEIARMARGIYTQAEYCPTVLFQPR